MWFQHTFAIETKRRGFHLITDEVIQHLPQLENFSIGLLHLFILHTSASLTINENADPDVRLDMETMLNRVVPENQVIRHTLEGPDDMPAHLKSSLLGCQLTIPIAKGNLVLGIWQGIYLCEHRNRASARSITATIHGLKA